MNELLPLDGLVKKEPKTKRLNRKAAKRSVEIEEAWKAAWTCSGLPAWAKDAYFEVWSEAYSEICWLRTKKQATEYEKSKGLAGGTVSKYVGPNLSRILAYLRAHDPKAPISKAVKEMRMWCGEKIVRKNVDCDEWCPLEYVEDMVVVDEVADLTDKTKTGIQDRHILVSPGVTLKGFSPKKTKRVEVSWKTLRPVTVDRVQMPGGSTVGGFSILLIKDKLMAYWASLKGLEQLLAQPELEQMFFSTYMCWDVFDEVEFWPRQGCRKWLEDLADRRLSEIMLAKLKSRLVAEIPGTLNVFLGVKPGMNESFQRWTGKIANNGKVQDVVFTRKTQPKESPLSFRAMLEAKGGFCLDKTSANAALTTNQPGARVAHLEAGLPDTGFGKDGPVLNTEENSPNGGG